MLLHLRILWHGILSIIDEIVDPTPQQYLHHKETSNKNKKYLPVVITGVFLTFAVLILLSSVITSLTNILGANFLLLLLLVMLMFAMLGALQIFSKAAALHDQLYRRGLARLVRLEGAKHD